MRLDEYLFRRKETASSFAARSGVLRPTILAIKNGHTRCRIDHAQAIVRASEAQPGPKGETVTYDDLVPATGDEAA